jgi:formylmethanofuran dehydrogenase subunit B
MIKRGAPNQVAASHKSPPKKIVTMVKKGNFVRQGNQRNRGNDSKQLTIVTMPHATKVAKVTKVTMETKTDNHTSLFDPLLVTLL